MLLENLREFDWMNEPANVRFDEKGMHVVAKYRTDFWCCAKYGFRKDDGHFFYSYVLGDFCCTLDWEFDESSLFDQCGAMIRVDADNWFKCSVLSEKEDEPLLATCLTVNGYSDLATIALPNKVNHIWYRIKKYKGCYIASYSIDGENFVQLRKFYMANDVDDIRVGAYLCSPQKDDFEALLHDIRMTDA